ncbi:5-formyltetrahydrofolate cyclo-ligase [Caldibacillus lycopersici]|uniref:5-formyltetrahydrofolate cyclo-ligase n=1 Tax=Perspicuibacillus lycopersici TaxID=1325689 RepID=A0AAE3IV00_9BACI|nr:5-formyltetrahydrofolate cyclo-ligase [Perspicuibacillus lycopersici]MCU9613879.1 5-formyltetrahydrofolate cyclo-ligase [Perspicuibacillus lycopersici]
MKEQKNVLRQTLIHKLKQLDRAEYEMKSDDIAKNLFQSQIWSNAAMIGITISIFPEVDTYNIIQQAWKEKKLVTAAKCIPKTRELNFYQITDFQQLAKGYFGLYEPITEQTKLVQAESIDTLIIPGVAFTPTGFRLGFGGGYYDRYIPTFKGIKLALAFQEQLLADLPVEEHDQKVDMIITEKGVYYCNDK